MASKTPPSMKRADYLQMHRERRELIAAAVKAGVKSYREIAAEFGISGARVTGIAKKAGVARKIHG
jgi:transposase